GGESVATIPRAAWIRTGRQLRHGVISELVRADRAARNGRRGDYRHDPRSTRSNLAPVDAAGVSVARDDISRGRLDSGEAGGGAAEDSAASAGYRDWTAERSGRCARGRRGRTRCMDWPGPGRWSLGHAPDLRARELGQAGAQVR